jgi:hypothetical protein
MKTVLILPSLPSAGSSVRSDGMAVDGNLPQDETQWESADRTMDAMRWIVLPFKRERGHGALIAGKVKP